ncbi:MAG: acetylornithine deacetylase [Granulosicoccaceae bacterium]
MQSIDILEQLIRFDTVSRNPNMALMGHIASVLETAGIACTLLPDSTGNKANLYATIGPGNLPGVMLSGHTDVVPIDNQDWTKPAFSLTETDGKLYGRGTCDMKGFVACAIKAALIANELDLKTPLHLAFSYDEEIGCIGVASLIDLLHQAPVKPAMCIVGEPTLLSIATGHKGKIALRATCTGSEAHSALAPTAVNAIHLGCDLVDAVREVQSELAIKGNRDDAYDINYTTLHIGNFNAGTVLNIVPSTCIVDFEIRNINADNPNDLIKKIKQALAPSINVARKIAPNADIVIEPVFSYPGLETPTDAPIVDFVKGLTGGNTTCKVAFGTEGGLFSGSLGIPTVVCGPGSMQQGHKPDEYIEIEQMNRCDAMLESLLAQLETGL